MILSSISISEFKREVESDATLLWVTEAVKFQWPAESDKDVCLMPFYKLHNELIVVEGLLVRGDILVPPATLRSRIVALVYEAHSGIVRAKQRLRK